MSIEQHQFKTLLAALASLSIDDIPVAKYRYASAGSLYPVQVYVQLRQGAVDGIDGGVYYLNGQDAQLYHINANDDKSEFALQPEQQLRFILVAKDSAIKPIYGALAEPFCAIEAGGITQLLNEVAADLGLASGQVNTTTDQAEVLASLCRIEQDSRVVCSFNVFKPQTALKQTFARQASIQLLSES